MIFLNEYEVEEAVEKFGQHETLGLAVRTLDAYRRGVNRVSDGWPYWRPALQAAAPLMEIVDGALMARVGEKPTSATPEQIKTAITRMKGFATRKKVPVEWPTT